MPSNTRIIPRRLRATITYSLILALTLSVLSGAFLKGLVMKVALADTSAQTLPFSQNWTNTGLITTDDNWSGVPGIIGYRGDGVTASTGIDPQTVVADGSATPVDVNANRSDPNTFTTGGVTEFDGIANPVVALQGSSTARAPHLVIALNTTGQTNINVSYNLRDIDGSADNSVQPVALQYRVGGAGNYTNIPAGFVADASSGPNLATLVTPVSVTLPAACENQSLVQLRIITTDAVGSDEWIGVDDISVTAGAGPVTPILNINDVALGEGNSGTTNFNFTVSLTAPAPAGGVTFNASTADGTATTANSDYVGFTNQPFTITQGNTSTTVTVAVNGDTTNEPNETFFVNITNIVGANAGDTQGQGTINNDDGPLTKIHDIQGSGNSSPIVGSSVNTTGIVTGLRSNGFFIQEPDATVDADPNTSEGVFVFTSSAPPAAAAVGNSVLVTATVSEFIPTADPSSPPQTELTSPTTSLLSTGNTLPTPHTITASETLVNDLNNLEKYEGMRVTVSSLTAVSGTQGSKNEANATSTSTGIFYGVITGVARPFREPGIEVPDPVPTPYPSGSAPANVPRFDFNPERLRVNSLAQPGSSALDVTSGEVITSITGPLDYGFRTYTIDVDPPTVTPAPGVSGQGSAVNVPVASYRELTIASFNMERFFDTTDDPNTSDVVLTSTAFNNRLSKASLAIRNVLQSPDVIGVEEMENLTTLQAVATKVNNDAVAAAQPNPNYQAYLAEGNDVGGIDVGFLVKASRINVFSVTQYNLTETYTNPDTNASALLNDRPPLALRASLTAPDGSTFSFTVIVNHLRSLSGIDSTTSAHTRVKRQKQADSLATLINEMENGGARQVLPYDQNIVSVGDYNAFEFNDGYVDVMGAIKGTPAPADQVVEANADLINPDLTDLTLLVPSANRYSYSFDGDAQVLDHELVNNNMLARFTRQAYGRMDADFPEIFRSDPNRPERLSDHDPAVAYFALPITPTAAPASVSGRVVSNDGAPLGGVVMQLDGARSYRAITDSDGRYSFNGVEPGELYNLMPSRVNFSFNPAARSINLVGNLTNAVFTGTPGAEIANPLDTPEYFVRQQYLDFLGREPDEGGLNFWSSKLSSCGQDYACLKQARINVSAAFFQSEEFQQTGSFIYRLYGAALGSAPVYAKFMADRSRVVDGSDLAARREAFVREFVGRAEFLEKYPLSMTAEQYVDAVLASAQNSSGADLSLMREQLLSEYAASGDRSRVLLSVAESDAFKRAEYNRAFVLMQYFGYLRRDADSGGYQFWLDVLNNRVPGNYQSMVCAFITSTEYQRRFASVVTRSNSECGN